MSPTDEPLGLLAEVPIASFRVPQAREYFETYPVPPLATVYGMLLSYVGEPWRCTHVGARVAVATLSTPSRSLVLRTMRRFKDREIADESNAKPDFQELLCGVELAIWVDHGPAEGEAAHPPPMPLRSRLLRAFEEPSGVQRFGGLCLGESTNLVDVLRLLRPGETVRGRLLQPDPEGELTLPVWPDHVGSAGTRWGRYTLRDFDGPTPPAAAFEVIAPAAQVAGQARKRRAR